MNEQNPAVDLAEAVRVLGLCAVEGDTYAAAVLAGLEARGAAIERVRELHAREWHRSGEVTCSRCFDVDMNQHPWPCPTIAALDGGAPGERQ